MSDRDATYRTSIKVKVTIQQATKGQEGSRVITLLLDLGARRGWVVSNTPRPLYPKEKPGTHCTGGWVLPGPVWTCEKNLAPTGIRSPDRPTLSQSLY
jgi:hypothetical protein